MDQENDKIKLLYDAASSEYDLGSYDEFAVKIQDPSKRRALYDAIGVKYNLGSYSEFESKVVDSVKKKDTSEVLSPEESMVSTSEMDSSDFKEASKKAAEDPKYDVGDYEFDDRFSAGAKDVYASILRIPQFLQEQAATIVGSFDPELQEALDSMSREERDIFLGNIPTVSSVLGTSGTTMASEEYTKEAEKIRDSFQKFDTSITEDIMDLELGRAAGRLFNETVGAVPSIIQAFIPGVGIGSIALGSAAQKSKELQDKGEELGIATSLNSIITGAGEGLLETFTKKIGGKFFKSLKGKSEEFVMKSMKGFAKEFGIDFLGEGASESGSLLIGKLADYAISGDEKAFENSLYEFTDTFLVGGFATGPISGATQGVNITKQIAKKREIDRAVGSTKYNSLSDAFTKENVSELDNDQLSLVGKDSAESLLELQLAERLKKKEINNAQSKEILDNFKEVKTLSNEVDGLDLDDNQKQQAINLIKEKKTLEKTIQGKDENLVSKQKNRIEEINNNLKSLSEGVDIAQQEEVAITQEVTPTEEVAVEETPVVQEEAPAVQEDVEVLDDGKLKYKTSSATEVVVDQSGKFVNAIDVKTGKERKTRSTILKSQDDLINQKDYTIGKSAFDDVPQGQFISDPSDLVATKSENPQEIALEYLKAKERQSVDTDPVIENFVGKYKVSGKSLKDYYGSKDDLPNLLGYLKGEKGRKAQSLDTIAIEVSEMAGRQVTPQELFDIMMDPRYKSNTRPKESEIVTDLRNRFIDVTGLLATDGQIQKIANQDPSKLKPVNEPLDVVIDQAIAQSQLERDQAAKEEKAEEEAAVEKEPQETLIEEAVVEEQRKSRKEQIKEKQAEENVFISTDQILGKGGFIDGLKRRWISYKKFLPESLFKAKEARDGAIKKYTTRAEAFARSYDKTVNKIVNSDKTIKNKKQAKQNIQTEFDKLLRGEITPDDSTLNDDLLILATKMRTQIDALSNELVRLGYIKSRKSVENIVKNKGKYLNRSYKVFTNKNWKDAVSDEIKQQAKNYILDNASKLRGDQKYSLSEKARKMAFGEDISYEQALEDLVDLEIDKILNRDVTSGFIKSAATGSLNRKILKQRKDIPLPIRQLMGEDIDPANNYMNSVLKLSALVENVKYQNQIRKNGLGIYFFEEGDVNRPKEFSKKITSDKSDAFPLLKGLYTTPELAEAFEAQQKNNSEFMNNFMMVGGYVKWAKTVGSIATHFKNFFGNTGFAMINGHYDMRELKKSWETVIGDLRGLTNDEFRAKFEKYVELGIIKQSASIGDVKAAIDYKNSDDVFQQILANEKKNNELKKSNAVSRLINKTIPTSRVAEVAATKISETASKTKTLLDNLYQSEDDFWKIHGYENELSQYSKALFGKEKSQLTPEERAKVDEEVSEIIKNQYPTYDRVPEIIKRLGKNPFFGAFVSFQAESIRTAFNTYTQFKKELKSTNPEIRKIGAKRMAAASIYATAKLAVFSALGTLLIGGEDDDEEKKDVRKFLPPWSKNSSILLFESEPGKLSYLDMTANDPHAIFSKLVNAAVREEDIVSKFTEASLEILKPFVGKDLLFSAATEIFNNEKSNGSPLYKDGDTTFAKIEAVRNRILELIEPGTFTTIRRGYDAYRSDDKKLGNEIIGLTGFRPVSLDLKTSLFFNIKDLNKDIADQKSVYNSARYKQLSDSSIDLDSKYIQVNDALKEKYLEGHELIKSGMRIGLTDREIAKILKDQRFSQKEVNMMFSGRIYDYQPSKMRR
jgi:hypothetical protein